MNQEAIDIVVNCWEMKSPELNLSGQRLIKKLTDADFNEDNELCRWLAKCVHIRRLDLSNNQISEISGLEDLILLRELDVSENQISEISGLVGLTNLQTLDLGGNQIFEINALDSLFLLRELNLRDNQISEPKGLGNLILLRQLNLSRNQISQTSRLGDLIMLEQLYLSGNQISEINGLDRLKLLRVLDLSGNQIYKISGLITLKSLQVLDLGGNLIYEISGLESLSSLYELGLNDNLISEVNGLGYLIALKTLDLSNNHIGDIRNLLPWLMRSTKPLKIVVKDHFILIGKGELNLYGNPLIAPPMEIVMQGNEAVLRYFEKINQEGSAHIHEAKLILVGEGGTGKTSLQWRLQDDNSTLPQPEGRTRGIDIVHWAFKVEGEHRHIAHIWDFGGQDVYYPVHRFFLTENAVFVLLASTRIAHHNFDYWIPTIYQFGGKSPIILGQTCHDGNKVAWTDLGYYVAASDKFNIIKTGVLPYHELNLLNRNEGLAEIKKAITQQLSALPHYGKAVPTSWAAVRDAIASIAKEKSCIAYQQFTELCRETNSVSFGEAIAIEDCARFLHSIGVILWYADMETLKDWVVLQPEWAMNAVYKIIDDEEIQNRRGLIQAGDFLRLWQEECYENMHGVLKSMLQVFKMAFQQKYQPSNYIMPARLLFMPTEARWPVEEPGLRLSYKYEFMPRGMVNQLSAELSRYIINGNEVWNDSVNLEFEKARCQVREEFHKGIIYIKAIGSDARALIAMVMNALKDITDSYRGVTPQIFVPCTCSVCNQLPEPTIFLYDKLLQWEQKRNHATVTCNESGEQLLIDSLLRNVGLSNPFKEAQGTYRKKLFISYSKHDEEYKEEFSKHLVTLKEQKLISSFNCKEIELGVDWDETIQRELDECDIMICLVSVDFLNTDYIRKYEVEKAMDKGKQVIPIIIKPCDWEPSNIGKLFAPNRGKNISLDQELFLRNIIKETTPIERAAWWVAIVKEMREKLFTN